MSMFYPIQLCIIIDTKCNLKCSYCFQRQSKLKNIYFNPEILNYLKSLDPSITQCVCFNGGEPLLQFDIIKNLINYIPNNIHKKIITNGTLLNKDIINYFNKSDIEVAISHDGPNTSLTRGIDIFSNTDILNLIKKIKNLTIHYVINKQTLTKYGYVNWFDQILERKDYKPLWFLEQKYEYSILPNLVKNKIYLKPHPRRVLYKNRYTGTEPRKIPMMIALGIDGNFYSMDLVNNYGSFTQSIQELNYKIDTFNHPHFDFCRNNKKCLLRSTNYCRRINYSSDIHCKYKHLVLDSETKYIYF